MINKILLPLILSYGLLLTGDKNHETNYNSVNEVLGDISFIQKFGVEPEATTKEKLRLTIHLEYVEYKLRSADVTHLSTYLKTKRLQLLDYLKEYIEAESYPMNYHFPERRQSVFIDKNGNICAVGYLVERSVGRPIAEEINSKHKFSSIFDIEGSEFEQWVTESGLTKKELAMIQPAYQPPPNPEPVDKAYDVSTSILVGMNTTLSFINASRAVKGAESKKFPIVGLISGTGQLVLGIVNYPENNSVNKRERKLSLLNIGFGTLTIALSSYNLFKIKESREKSYAVRLKSFSLPQNNSGIGIGFSKSF
ncbi:MAG: hypothetical protein ABJK11_01540 [Balneola sp.]